MKSFRVAKASVYDIKFMKLGKSALCGDDLMLRKAVAADGAPQPSPAMVGVGLPPGRLSADTERQKYDYLA